MKQWLIVFAALIAVTVLWAANNQPILIGGTAGKISFPGSGSPPFLNGSSGHLSVNSITPWTGSAFWIHAGTDANLAVSDGTFVGGLGSGVALHALDDAAAVNMPLDLRGSYTIIRLGNVGIGGTNHAYPLDVTGDVNSSTLYRVGGVAGVGGSISVNTTSASGISSVTPSTDTAVVSVGYSTSTIQYKDWGGANQSATFVTGVSFSTGSFVVSISTGTTSFLTGASASANTFSGGIRTN